MKIMSNLIIFHIMNEIVIHGFTNQAQIIYKNLSILTKKKEIFIILLARIA